MPDPIPNPDPNPKQARLLQLLRAYGDVVPTSLFGHHHTESLRVVRDAQGVARHVMYLSPALTPRNPRFQANRRMCAETVYANKYTMMTNGIGPYVYKSR